MLLKKGKSVSMFNHSCINCSMKNICMSATSLVSPERKYLFKLKGYREPTNEAMLKGIARHEEYQEGMPQLDDKNFIKFLNDTRNGREIEYAEVWSCSPFYGIRGIIDVLKIRYNPDKNKYKITIRELKSSFMTKHLIQLMAYGMIYSDLKMLLSYSEPMVKKNKKKRITFKLYPKRNILIDIDLYLKIFNQEKEIHIPFMRDNIILDEAKGFTFGIKRRLQVRRQYHKGGYWDVKEIGGCEECNPKWCSFYNRFCCKIGFPKDKVQDRQKFFGKKQLLIKTKPKIFNEVRLK